MTYPKSHGLRGAKSGSKPRAFLSNDTDIFPLKSFIEIQFLYHKIYPFKVNNSMAFVIFAELCKNYHDQF